MTIDEAVKEAYRRVTNHEDDPLATWILDTFGLPIARINANDVPDVMGWGHDVVELDESFTGSWCADDAFRIATRIILRAEDARDECLRDVQDGTDP